MIDYVKLNLPALTEIKNLLEKLNEILILILEKKLPKFLAIETVEELFKINKQTLNRLAKKGQLKKYKLSIRKIYFATEEISYLIE